MRVRPMYVSYTTVPESSVAGFQTNFSAVSVTYVAFSPPGTPGGVVSNSDANRRLVGTTSRRWRRLDQCSSNRDGSAPASKYSTRMSYRLPAASHSEPLLSFSG